MASRSERARILERALERWPDIEFASALDRPLRTLPLRCFDMRILDRDDLNPQAVDARVEVDVETGRCIISAAKNIIERELQAERFARLRRNRIEPVGKALADAGAWLRDCTPAATAANAIARLRALSASGKLDRWHTCGDNAAEIGEALRLIPQVLQQLDAVTTELRGAE